MEGFDKSSAEGIWNIKCRWISKNHWQFKSKLIFRNNQKRKAIMSDTEIFVAILAGLFVVLILWDLFKGDIDGV